MEGLCNIVSMNISGRFTGREIKNYGQEVIKYILTERSVALLFGQQTNFRPDLPEDYDIMGGSKAFLIYDTRQIIAGDEKHYKWYLRDLELQDRLPKNYLPENNYIVCKMRVKKLGFQFIAMSWVTDEVMGKQKSTSTFKKVCSFIDNLAEVEEMPVLLSGTFRIAAEDAKDLVPYGFRCCSYIPANRRRHIRRSNFFVCSRSLTFTDLMPMICAKMDIDSSRSNGKNAKLINPEDVFYFDPVGAVLHTRQNIFLREAAIKLNEFAEQNANGMVMLIENGVDHSESSGSVSNMSHDQSHDQSDDQSHDQADYRENQSEPEMEEVACSKPRQLQKVQSFVELYDEDVMQNNGLYCATPLVCKMQRVNSLLVSLTTQLAYQFKEVTFAMGHTDINTSASLSDQNTAALKSLIRSISAENVNSGHAFSTFRTQKEALTF